MPVYEQAYRAYEARAPLRRTRFWPITREALRLLLQRKALLGLLAVSWLQFVARVLQIYIVTRFPEAARVLPVDGRLFGEFLVQQGIFVVLLTVFGGAGLVANDLRTGAVLVYLSRPLTRRDYVLGKLSVLLILNGSVTVAPALLLYLVGLGLAPDHYLKLSLAWIAPAILAFGLTQALVLALLGLACSSLTRSARVAGLWLVAGMFALEMARGLVGAVYRTPYSALLSPSGTLRVLGGALFGLNERAYRVPWEPALGLLVLLGLGCLWVLRARVRAVEVVQ